MYKLIMQAIEKTDFKPSSNRLQQLVDEAEILERLLYAYMMHTHSIYQEELHNRLSRLWERACARDRRRGIAVAIEGYRALGGAGRVPRDHIYYDQIVTALSGVSA